MVIAWLIVSRRFEVLRRSVLGMGTIPAIFHSCGNAPLLNDILKSVVRLVPTPQAQDFSILTEMSSAPVDLANLQAGLQLCPLNKVVLQKIHICQDLHCS